MYSTSLYEYLHQSETPLARTRRTGIENLPRTALQETERKDEVQEEPKQNVWISKTVKRAKDTDQRMTAREKFKQRLTKKPTTLTPPPTNEMEISIFESEDEGEEDTVMDGRKDGDEIREDEVLSRLRRQEQEYLQEQEETKREVLLESTTGSTTGSATGSTMEEMMERKIKLESIRWNNDKHQ
jgi:hypothetical protein